ncbi:MAG: NAD(P)-dependent oxidoreductase [Rectinema sp.]
MNIVVTGAFGNVGRSAVNACLDAGHRVGIFEAPHALAKAKAGVSRLVKGRWRDCRYAFGDVREPGDVMRALALFPEGTDAVIHLAALIPPAADKKPGLARDINVGGTSNMIEACKALPHPPRFVLASSVAVYGDRLDEYWISSTDKLAPDDTYGRSKVACEEILRASGLDFTILRLTYVVWYKWRKADPYMFAMPARTRLEVVHTEDAGRAFAAAASTPGASGKTLNIGGGASCRTVFRAYLDRMFRCFGLGNADFLTDEAFAKNGFHCGWFLDSDEAEALLGFRRKTLEDYYDEVRWDTRFIRPFGALAAPFIRTKLKSGSPFVLRSAAARQH